MGEGRYMLVGTYTLPTSLEGRPLHLKEEPPGPDDRCRNPGGEGDGSAVSGEPDLDGPAGSCRNPGGEGDGSAAAGEPSDQPLEGGIFDDEEEGEKKDEKGEDEEKEDEKKKEDPMEIQEDLQGEEPQDESEDDTKKWKERIEYEEGFKIGQLTFMEILPDRKGSSVIEGMSRLHARLRYLGLPLFRLHSDRAAELRTKSLRRWANQRQVLRTYTEGDDYKMNGRVESAIKVLKGQVRTLLTESGESASLWPLAARHAAERKLRHQLAGYGLPVRELLPFGSTGFARQKIWSQKYEDWKLTRRKVKVLGPDFSMSASVSGHFVRGTDGKFFRSADVVVAEGPPEDLKLEDVKLGELSEPGVRRRIYGKTPMLSSLQIPAEEAEQRRLRGLKLLMEELDLQDLALSEYTESSSEEKQKGTDSFIRALLADVEELAEELDGHEKIQQETIEEEIEKETEAQQVFLQTRMYSLAEVRAELEQWKDSMWSEFRSLTEETGAVRVITTSQADELRREAEQKGILFERIPGKAIFSRKAGSGKRKCRACACGNYMSQRALTDTYAGGTGATEVRCLLKKGALEQWSAVTLDVKTAFLRAPRDHSREIVVVQPPHIFVLAGIVDPGSLWLVDRALYGLTTSPKEWTQFRNEKVAGFTWDRDGIKYEVQKTVDQDIWKIVQISPRCEAGCGSPGGEGVRSAAAPPCEVGCGSPGGEGVRSATARGWEAGCGSSHDERDRSAAPLEAETTSKVVGYFVTYVDDVLAVGDHQALQGFCQRVAQEWEIGDPEWVTQGGPPVRFLGMEIERRGATYRLHQESFVRSMLEKYPGERGSGLSHVKVPEEESEVDPSMVREAQRQTGELLWIARRTRPDVAYAISLMSQYATRRPRGVTEIGREVRAYLRTCPGLALEYGPLPEGDFGIEGTQRRPRHHNLVEVYTDASFASSNLRSTSGVVGFFAGSPVFWFTGRQSFVTLSTAEAELMAMLEGLTSLRCIKSIVDMLQGTEAEGRMFSDSTAGISIALGTTGSWRTRHLRIRAQGLHEAIERGETTLEHQPGKSLVADGMTKQLLGTPLKRFVHALGMEMEIPETIQLSSLRWDGGDSINRNRLTDGLGLMVAAASLMITPVEAVEDLDSEGEGSWFGVILTMLVISILIVGDLVTRFGLPTLKSWICPRPELKVKLMSEHAVLPTRGTVGSAGLDLSSSEDYRIGQGDYLLVKTGLAVELPRGTYGRLASRSSMAAMGVEVSAGVIDRDYRGEIKVLIHNQSTRDFWIRRGDRIAQLIVEKMMEVEVQQVENLTTTSRGKMGFGSTGVESEDPSSRSLRSLRIGTPVYSGGSSATRGEEERTTTSSTSTPWPSSTTRPNPMTSEEGDQEPLPVTGEPNQAENQEERRRVTAEELRSQRPPVPPVQMSDIVSEHQPTTVDGCPGLVKWHLMMPSQWISKPGESLEELADRSGFAKFWPLHVNSLWMLLEEDIPSPKRDRWEEIKLNSTTAMMVRILAQPRRKIYDFQNDTMPGTWSYGLVQLTIAKMESGGYQIISGHRCGLGSTYLEDRWTGVTCFLKVQRA
eukprot:s480_g11.t1